MGAINFKTLTKKGKFALVNEPQTEEEREQQYFFNYPFEEIKAELEQKNFYYFSLQICFGYYEGFCLTLTENNTKYIYENRQEQKEVLKELTQIKKVLLKFIQRGLVWGCYPSWVYSRTPTAEAIQQTKEAIKQLKEETKRSYTERTAKKENKGLFDIIKELES